MIYKWWSKINKIIVIIIELIKIIYQNNMLNINKVNSILKYEFLGSEKI